MSYVRWRKHSTKMVVLYYLSVTLSRHFLDLGNNFAVTRDDLEDTIKQQRNEIEELEREKDQLDSSLVQSQERIFYLQQEVNTWFIKTQNSIVCVKKLQGIYDKNKYTFLIYIEQAKNNELFLVSRHSLVLNRR